MVNKLKNFLFPPSLEHRYAMARVEIAKEEDKLFKTFVSPMIEIAQAAKDKGLDRVFISKFVFDKLWYALAPFNVYHYPAIKEEEGRPNIALYGIAFVKK